MPNGGRLTLDVKIETKAEEAEIEGISDSESPGASPGHFVVLTVADTGTGMSEDVVSRAFEPFFTTKEVGKGTGLGLSQVHGFVEQSSGRAEIQSRPGEGTSISLYLPAIDAPVHGAALETSSDRQGTAMPRGSETILVVEDNADVRSQVCKQLETLGYAVIVAASGDEALEQLKSNRHFDLLFTDVVMPGELNGRDLAEHSVRLRPELPVLLTSGYAEQSVFPEGRVPGGMRLLNKPYRRSALAHALREVLSPPANR